MWRSGAESFALGMAGDALLLRWSVEVKSVARPACMVAVVGIWELDKWLMRRLELLGGGRVRAVLIGAAPGRCA